MMLHVDSVARATGSLLDTLTAEVDTFCWVCLFSLLEELVFIAGGGGTSQHTFWRHKVVSHAASAHLDPVRILGILRQPTFCTGQMSCNY